ncbi:MAG: FHA domain-containing protein [Chloroflexota bacterium]
MAEQYPGTLFCSECGSYLRQKAAPTTTLPPASAPAPATAPLKVTLRFSDQRELQVTLNKQLLIGRADSETGIRPDIDLTPYFGMELGVSRLHATLQQGSGGVQLIDRSSTNGTYINNYQLVPEKPYLLGQGDQITLGSLEINVYFE